MEGISGSKRIVIGDAGHWMYLGKSAECSQRVIGCMESIRFLRWQSCCGDFGVAQPFSAAIGD
jgi:hypothetical protein